MLEEKNNLVNSFIYMRNLIQSNGVSDDVKLVIHAHKKTIPGHVRKYNLSEATEVAALVVGEH